MNAELRDEFQRRLEARRQHLLDEGDIPIEQSRKDPSQIGGDEDEQPLTEMNQALASSRNKVRAQELSLVDAALSRLKREPEEFGLCVTCEEPIAAKRLEAMPHARMCVTCQSAADPVRRGARRNLTDFV